MIDYAKTARGDILRVVGAGAPGYAANGDLVRVLEVHQNAVLVENEKGESCKFVFNCGAARLEPTEWTNDFPPYLTAEDDALVRKIESGETPCRAVEEMG